MRVPALAIVNVDGCKCSRQETEQLGCIYRNRISMPWKVRSYESTESVNFLDNPSLRASCIFIDPSKNAKISGSCDDFEQFIRVYQRETVILNMYTRLYIRKVYFWSKSTMIRVLVRDNLYQIYSIYINTSIGIVLNNYHSLESLFFKFKVE